MCRLHMLTCTDYHHFPLTRSIFIKISFGMVTRSSFNVDQQQPSQSIVTQIYQDSSNVFPIRLSWRSHASFSAQPRRAESAELHIPATCSPDPQAPHSSKNTPSTHGPASALAGPPPIRELQHPSSSQDRHSSHHTSPSAAASMLPMQLKVALRPESSQDCRQRQPGAPHARHGRGLSAHWG